MIVPENIKGMSIDAPGPVEEKAPKMKRGQSLLRKLGRSQRWVSTGPTGKSIADKLILDLILIVRKICPNCTSRT
jgi:hypothetical protein